MAATVNLKSLGEFGLIDRIRRISPAGRGVVVGIGDDAAVLALPRVGAHRDAPLQLMTTDMLIEGRHFTRKNATPRQIGWKAMAVNLSDVAAMGGKPTVAVVAVGLPPKFTLKEADGLYQGLSAAARRFGVSIAGGDTNASPHLVVAVTLLGEADRRHLTLRRGARPADAVWVTGSLGGSLASGRHLRFMPRVREARWLVSRFRIHAMMDLSDGLSSDLRRMAEESGVGFRIEGGRIPISNDVVGAVHEPPLQKALSDGEDFELLFTLSPAESDRLQRTAGRPVRMTRIGVVTAREKGIVLVEKNRVRPLRAVGYDHFRR